MNMYLKVNIQEKMVEIFNGYCNLSIEEFEELKERLINLEGLILDNEQEEGEKEAEGLLIIIDWLYNIKELTLKQHYELGELVEDLRKIAQEAEET